MPIQLNYFVLTDMGECALRSYLREHEYTNISLNDEFGQKIDVLQPEIVQAFADGQLKFNHVRDDMFDNNDVVPVFLRQGKASESNQAGGFVRTLEAIGEQLVSGRSSSLDPRLIKRSALGSNRIGSTLLFEHSCPDACPAVFRLAGEIDARHERFRWVPLFQRGAGQLKRRSA